jgi:hypothetical protein
MKKTADNIKKKLDYKYKEKKDRPIKGTLDESGAEVLDPKPMFHEIGFSKPPSIDQKIRDVVQRQMLQIREELGPETFDEENNFNIDEIDLLTPYEQEVVVQELFEQIPQMEASDPAATAADEPPTSTEPEPAANETTSTTTT